MAHAGRGAHSENKGAATTHRALCHCSPHIGTGGAGECGKAIASSIYDRMAENQTAKQAASKRRAFEPQALQQCRAELSEELCRVLVVAVLKQVELAEALQACGADIIQTEGGTSSQPGSSGVMGLVEKATPTLAAAYSISRAVQVPVLCASGLSSVTVPLAFAAGASGVVSTKCSTLSDSPISFSMHISCAQVGLGFLHEVGLLQSA